MPWGDGTGPWWTEGRGLRCRKAAYLRQKILPINITLTKEEQRKILEEEKAELELELKQIEEKLKELK